MRRIFRFLIVLFRPDGTNFDVPPQKVEGTVERGVVVTFTYDRFSRRSIPLRPRIVRTRPDLSWEDVLSDATKDVSLNRKNNCSEFVLTFVLVTSQKAIGYTVNPYGHWFNEKSIRFVYA